MAPYEGQVMTKQNKIKKTITPKNTKAKNYKKKSRVWSQKKTENNSDNVNIIHNAFILKALISMLNFMYQMNNFIELWKITPMNKI